MSDILITPGGLTWCAACAPKSATKKQVEAAANLQILTGITSKWRIKGGKLGDGTPLPAPCRDDPNRVHYMLIC